MFHVEQRKLKTMKKIFVTSVIALLSINCTAQRLSAGVKTGVTNWLSAQRGAGNYLQLSADGQTVTWDKQVFVRYQARWPVAAELSLNHTVREMELVGMRWGCVWNSGL